MAKLSIKLDTRSVKAGGASPLKLAVGHKGQTAYIALGRNVRPDQWDEGSGTVVRHPRKNEINLEIIAALDRAERAMAELDTRAMTAAEIRDILAHPEARALVLTSWESKMAVCSTPGNREVYRQSLSALRAADPQFDTRSFGDISKSYLEDIDRRMAATRSINSRSIVFRCLRAVFNAALDEGLTTIYPFRQFSPKTEQTRKRSLTVEQLRYLRDLPLSGRAEEYRDLFMLMFYLRGVNAADLFEALPSALVGGRLEYRRKKTHKLYSVAVLPAAAEILERYKGGRHLLNVLDRFGGYKDYLHRLNDGLKALGGDLPSDLTTYWARHTWATLAYQIGVPVDVIGQALGHSDRAHATTLIYVRADLSKVDEANRRVAAYVAGEGPGKL
jgi:integrase